MKAIYILIVFCIASSCKKQAENSIDVIKIIVDMKTSKAKSIETIFSAIEAVPLETTENSLLKRCGKIICNDDKYYILDEGQNAIFIFDMQGHFLKNSMHKEGRGPGEYLSIVDFDINPQTGHIEILDVSAYKIRRYDEDFNFMNETTIPQTLYPITTFKIVTSDLLVFYSPRNDINDKLLLYSVYKNEVVGRFNIQSIKHRLPITQKYSFYMRDSDLFFTNRYPSNYIFQILYNEKKIKECVEFNFGKNTFRITNTSKTVLENNSSTEMNNDQFVFPYTKHENDFSYFSFVEFKNELHLVSYNKESKLTKVVPCKFTDGGMILPPKFVDNIYFYVLAEPHWIDEMAKKTLLNSRSQEVIKTLKEDDNPILLKYKLIH